MTFPIWRNSLLLLMLLIFISICKAQHISNDTVKNTVSLDSVVISRKARGGLLRTTDNGKIIWDLDNLNRLPKILGVSDPLHYSQMLPGVSVNGEYDAGIRVHGCENGHNQVNLNGTPIYGASHLLGIFSVFNPSHYNRMSLSKDMQNAALPNRLGAVLDINTSESFPQKTTGEATVGLVSSNATIDIPTSKNSHLKLSARASYINFLYGNLLENDDMRMNYSFYDTNISYARRAGNNLFNIDIYGGQDNVRYLDYENDNTLRSKWGNAMVSMNWRHDSEKFHFTNKAYFTRYHTSFTTEGNDIGGKAIANASIEEWGYKGKIEYGSLIGGVDASFYNIKPQSYSIYSDFLKLNFHESTIHPSEISTYTDYSKSFSRYLMMDIGLRTSVFASRGHYFGGVFPSCKLSYKHPTAWECDISYSFRKQFLVLTGLSSLGSPLEYWICSGLYGLSPQSSHNITCTFRYSTPNGDYTLAAEAYTKWLNNQVEYNGTILSMFSSTYSPRNALITGRGFNYGFNIMLMKNHGMLTGWISYGYSPAKRFFHTSRINAAFHSSHERLHELKAVATLKLNKQFDIGATMVYASGSPYTRSKYLMIIEQQLVPIYSSYNASRLSHYFRLDLSADYCIKRTKRTRQSLNLSIYNCTARENEIFRYVKANTKNFNYQSMKNIMRVLPSISYTIQF